MYANDYYYYHFFGCRISNYRWTKKLWSVTLFTILICCSRKKGFRHSFTFTIKALTYTYVLAGLAHFTYSVSIVWNRKTQRSLVRGRGTSIHISIRNYIYSAYYQNIVYFFIHSTVFLFVNHDGIYVPPSNWLHPIWIYFVCYDLKEFAFSHDKVTSSLKEYFHALEMDKMHKYVVFTYKAPFQWRHLFVLMRKQYGRHVNFNYLPPEIKFGAFRLKLAHNMQKSPDRHRLQWTYRLNCTDTIYAILGCPYQNFQGTCTYSHLWFSRNHLPPQGWYSDIFIHTLARVIFGG